MIAPSSKSLSSAAARARVRARAARASRSDSFAARRSERALASSAETGPASMRSATSPSPSPAPGSGISTIRPSRRARTSASSMGSTLPLVMTRAVSGPSSGRVAVTSTAGLQVSHPSRAIASAIATR